MKNEVWKDIPGYEGYYQISNFGGVKSLERVVISKKGQRFEITGKILRQIGRSRGRKYMAVHLLSNGKALTASVHRLVAEAFIPNPNRLPFINHKDENPGNNTVENLEWCDHAYNMNYGTANEKRSKALLNNTTNSKVVKQYDLYGNHIATYPSTMEARRQTGVYHIPEVCNGRRERAGGYVWKYVA